MFMRLSTGVENPVCNLNLQKKVGCVISLSFLVLLATIPALVCSIPAALPGAHTIPGVVTE
jgi:hypothetical protein